MKLTAAKAKQLIDFITETINELAASEHSHLLRWRNRSSPTVVLMTFFIGEAHLLTCRTKGSNFSVAPSTGVRIFTSQGGFNPAIKKQLERVFNDRIANAVLEHHLQQELVGIPDVEVNTLDKGGVQLRFDNLTLDQCQAIINLARPVIRPSRFERDSEI